MPKVSLRRSHIIISEGNFEADLCALPNFGNYRRIVNEGLKNPLNCRLKVAYAGDVNAAIGRPT